MSFRASEGAQWSDPGAAVRKRAAYLVLQDNGFYTVSTTGPADAYLGASGTRVTIDPAATAHANGASLLKVGTRFRIF
jgi:hypothetical protein